MKILSLTGAIIMTLNLHYAQAANTPDTVQGVGYVEPVNDILRLNFKHRGIIQNCSVFIGQQVKKGELLAKQDDSEERAALAIEEANAALARAELKQVLAGINPAQIKARQADATAKKAENDYVQLNAQRMNRLLSHDAIATANRDSALSDARRVAAQVSAAEAEIEYLRNYVRPVDKALAEAKVALAEAKVLKEKARLAQTELRAPSDGVVLEILHHAGDVADEMNAEPVLLFADISRLQIRAEIDENYALLLKENQSVSLFGRGLADKQLTGVISLVKPIMGKKTVFTKTATERKDIDTRQVFIALPAGTQLPIGLETDVAIKVK
ncbi:MAG: efflux RND transporter periplasmic adaptor subunit [Methylococcaceae bacterium]